MDMGLAGKRVLITGGSKGIGLACAEGFAREGADLVLVGRDAATLATWRRVLVPGGRVLLVGAVPDQPHGFAVRWIGYERWRGAPAAVLEGE